MKYLFGISITLIIAITAVLFSRPLEAPARASGGTVSFNFIFADNTPDDYLEEVHRNLTGELSPNFFNGTHWDPAFTATGDGGANQGDSLTLTWSIIPDGTFMPQQFSQDTGCNSSLVANLNAIYGAGNWQNEIANVFADWASKTGNIYVQVSDDGAAWPDSPGLAGIRGDIRIGGCTIDGNNGVLAFNFFPNTGDMKIDATDNWFASATLTTAFHNVISHEHGHGVGILHVCPINQTKLMEPIVTTAFKGLQHDDIRAIQRHHGDRNELIGSDNDTPARATDLGAPLNNLPISVQGVSIDDNSDTDWFKFNASINATVDVTITPIGSTYLNGPQNSNGSCSAGTPFNSLAVHNLGFEIIDSNGTTILATGNANPAGVAEALTNISVGAAGTKFIRVFGDTTDDIQLYDLQLMVKEPVNITKFASLNPIITGQPLTYTLTITNVSSFTVTNVVVTDTVPNNTTFNSASDGGSEAGNIVSWPAITELGPNDSQIRTFSVILATGLDNGTTIVNTAYVSASNVSAIQPSNTVATTVLAPMLTFSISPNPYPILATTTMITYTLTVQNVGGAAATNVVLTNTIPTSTTLAWASDGGSEDFPGVIVWSPGITINTNSSIIRTFMVTVTSTITDGNLLANTISATSSEGASIQNSSLIEIVGLKLYYLPIVAKNN